MNKKTALVFLFFLPILSESTENPVLWDRWYTVTVGDKAHYGYYHDRVEIKENKIFFQDHYWKNEEGFINEEHLGGLVQNNPELTPLSFNFQSKYRSTETKINGTAEGNILNIKISKSNQEYPIIRKVMPKNMIFEVFFPVWIGKHMSTLKEGKMQTFLALLEDNIEVGFSPVSGWVRKEKSDAFATKTKSQKITVNFQNSTSIWYVENTGAPVKIVNQTQRFTVEMSSEKVAKSFFSAL